jgi:uncharacterized protein
MGKVTLILGATNNPVRYASMAADMLTAYGHPIIPVGVRKGETAGVTIQAEFPTKETPIDTITLYVGPERQLPWYNSILKSGAKRIIFNPGTENEALAELAAQAGMEVLEACTLVMLRTGQYGL